MIQILPDSLSTLKMVNKVLSLKLLIKLNLILSTLLLSISISVGQESSIDANEGQTQPTVVELSSFQAKEVDRRVMLRWTSTAETNNSGFQVERRKNTANDWQVLGFVSSERAKTGQHYEYTDENTVLGAFLYRLKQINSDGSFQYSQTVEIELTPPKTYRLEQNYPNPFNPETFIRYELSETSYVQLVIYNTLGEKVRMLVNGEKPAGNYAVRWDGKNEEGKTVVSGTYFYSLKIYGDPVFSKQMLLLK